MLQDADLLVVRKLNTYVPVPPLVTEISHKFHLVSGMENLVSYYVQQQVRSIMVGL
jgi:hypothetical protein